MTDTRPSPRALRRDGVSVVFGWILTRGFVLVVMATIGRAVRGDVVYFHQQLGRLPELGLGGTLVEYPVPAASLLGIPALLGDSRTAYAAQFLLLVALVDAALLFVLFRADGGRRGRSTDFWLLLAPLIGPIMFNRFDLVPAALVAAAVIVAARRPALAGALIATGAAVKLWPAALFPALLARQRGRAAATASFVAVGGTLAVVSLLVAGFDRLVSPLTWQSDRGLQIESVWATPLAIARALGSDSITSQYSAYNAWETVGPGTGSMLAVASVASLAGLAVIVALCGRAIRAGTISPSAFALVAVAITAVVIVTSKTFSPQYLLWLAGAVAATLAVTHQTEAASTARRLALTTLAMALLSQVLFPTTYTWLLDMHGPWALATATAVLTARNALVLTFTVAAVRAAWTATSPSADTN